MLYQRPAKPSSNQRKFQLFIMATSTICCSHRAKELNWKPSAEPSGVHTCFLVTRVSKEEALKSRSSIRNQNLGNIVEWIRDLDWDMEPSLSRGTVRIWCGGCFWTRIGFCGSDGDHGNAAVATSLTRLFCFQTSRFISWESCSCSELRETCSSEPENLPSKLQEQFGRQGIRKRGRRWCGKRGKCRWGQHCERGCAFARGGGHGRGGERGRSQEEAVAVAERGDTGWGAGGG